MTECDLLQSSYPKWIDILNQYQDEISSRFPDIAQTDLWLHRGSMAKQAAARSPPHLTKSELERIMEWKLKRGKFRPGLLKLVQSNDEDLVEACTSKAFKTDDIEKAMSYLTELKGVGPATASAILSGWNKQVPFMADEAMDAIPVLGPIKYSMAFFNKFRHKVADICERINETAQADAEPLSIAEISRCLWLSAIINAPEKPSKKRRSGIPAAGPKTKKRS